MKKENCEILDFVPFENRNFESLLKSEQRSLILHFLYTVEIHNQTVNVYDVIRDYSVHYNIIFNNIDDVVTIVNGVLSNKNELDLKIKPFLNNWTFDRLSFITKLILRYALWDIIFNKTDSPLAINEAVELAKGFAENDSYRFINGVLDAWVKKNLN
jgi:N utilization substance protein B